MHRILNLPKRLIHYIVEQGHCSNTNDVLRLRNFAWLTLSLIFIGFLFLIHNILAGNYQIAFIVAFFELFSAGSLFLIIKSHQTNIAYHVNNGIFFITLFFLSFLDIKYGGRILWMYTYPLFSIFVFGYKAGSLWSLALLLSVAGSLEISQGLNNVYSEDFWLRLPITYFMVIWITAWLENDRRKYISALEKEIAKRTRLEEQLTTLARTDDLTKLYNRAHYWTAVTEEIARAQRYDFPLSIAVIDVDDFKHVNDTYGHPTGDYVLIYLSNLLTKRLRKSDIAARIGGEEFSIALPHTSLDDAKIIMERLRQEFSMHPFSSMGTKFNVTMSIGLCSIDAKHINMDQLYSSSDQALYKAKHNGKNRIECN